MEPYALLFTAKEIEHKLGRLPTFHYGPRVIDVDIIFYNNLCMDMPDLKIPHKLLEERAFVLKPLSDIAADWKHPVTGLTVRTMLEALPEDSKKMSLLEEMI